MNLSNSFPGAIRARSGRSRVRHFSDEIRKRIAEVNGNGDPSYQLMAGQSPIVADADLSCVLFDVAYYMMRYPDIAHLDPLNHFLRHGEAEWRWPNPLFETDFYVAQHRMICGEIELEDEPISHFLKCSKFTSPTPLLDAKKNFDFDAYTTGHYLMFLAGNVGTNIRETSLFRNRQEFKKPLEQQVVRDQFATSRHPIYNYAFQFANESTYRLGSRASIFFDDWRVNHLGGGVIPRAPLSWYLSQPNPRGSNGVSISICEELDFDQILGTLNAASSVQELLHKFDEYRENYRSNRQPHNQPEVSILIICMDSALATIATVATLLGLSKQRDFEILVLDNASSSEQQALLVSECLGVRIVRSENRVSFGEANNLLAEHARGEFLLFLNSDAFITPFALGELVHTLQTDITTVAVAPVLLFPDGRIQESGGQWFKDGSVVQYSKGLPLVISEVQEGACVYRSAACLLVRKDGFNSVNGYSFTFEPAYFEDTFLCLELSRLGAIRTRFDLKCVHVEGHTNNRPELIDVKRLSIDVNRLTFISRAHSYEIDHEKIVRDVFPERISASRRKALLVSPYGLMVGGGEQYLLNLAWLLSFEYEVTLAFSSKPSLHRFNRLLGELGIPHFQARLQSIESVRHDTPDLLVSMANSQLPIFPPVGRTSIYVCQFPFPEDEVETIKRLDFARGYDQMVVYSSFVKNCVIGTDVHGVWSDKITVVSPPVDVGKVRQTRHSSGTLVISSVGRFFESGHCKNQHLLIEAFEEFRTNFPNSSLVLLGGVAADFASHRYFLKVSQKSRGLPVKLIPNCSRRSLLAALSESTLYWHGSGLGVPVDEPWRMEHFGISPLEACGVGAIPLVPRNGGVGEVVGQLGIDHVYSDIGELVQKSLVFARGQRSLSSEHLSMFAGQYSIERFFTLWGQLITNCSS